MTNRRPLAKWLIDANEYASKAIKYNLRLHKASPPWIDYDRINAIYRECARRRANGENVEVDHIVPLNSRLVCGLHWHGNLQIITADENRVKSNYVWPDMPSQQTDLFSEQLTPDYFLECPGRG